MKLSTQVTQKIFLRVKEQYPRLNITRKDIETATIKPVGRDRDDNLRLKSFEKKLKCQLNHAHVYKMPIFSKLIVYLCFEDGETPANPSLIFIVKIVKDK